MLKPKMFSLFFLVLFAFPALVAQGAEFSASTADEIQAAFDASATNGEGDVITIAGGVYNLTETLAYVSKEQYSVEIRGNGRDATILDGGDDIQIMTIDTFTTNLDLNTSVSVSGIQFRNGYTQTVGGGGLYIVTRWADTIVEHCAFVSNMAEPDEENFIGTFRYAGGGGLLIANGNFYRYKGGDVTVNANLFKNNQSYCGGGCYISSNVSSYDTTIITNNILSGNVASCIGGGLFIEAYELNMSNNTLISNEAEIYGGGIYYMFIQWNYSFNNIVWNNTAGNEGGDMYFFDVRNDYIDLSNTVYKEKAFANGYTITELNPVIKDPNLDENYSPQSGSPCIDAGDNDAPGLACGDYKGNERTYNATIDIGAVEAYSTISENCTGDEDPNDSDSSTVPDISDIVDSAGGGGGGGGCFIGVIMTVDKDSEAYKAAERFTKIHNSERVQDEIDYYKDRLAPRVKKQKAHINETVSEQIFNDAENPAAPHIYVFVSNSMPTDVVSELVYQAYQLREDAVINFILRGFPKGGMLGFIERAGQNRYPLKISVDPLSFENYEISSVPSVVVNRAVKVEHPKSIKSALEKVQKNSPYRLSGLIDMLSAR